MVHGAFPSFYVLLLYTYTQYEVLLILSIKRYQVCGIYVYLYTRCSRTVVVPSSLAPSGGLVVPCWYLRVKSIDCVPRDRDLFCSFTSTARWWG